MTPAGGLTVWNWLVRDWRWPGAAAFAAFFLLAVAPVMPGAGGELLAVVFVQLPVYMIHQAEEHIDDRFRLHVNRVIGGGREALTPGATFVINALGVWAFDLAALYLAWYVSPSAGVAAGYLAVVNGGVHVLQAVRFREYNPGLVTAVVLLLPAGGWCVARCGADAGWQPHAAGLAAAVAVHMAIVAHVVIRLQGLPPAAADGAGR